MNALLELFAYGPHGWREQLLAAALMTVAVSLCAFATGVGFGILGAWARLSPRRAIRTVAAGYVTVFRGIPELLVIYVFYFGGSEALTWVGRLFGGDGPVSLSGFVIGMLSIGIVSGAYETEVFRGAYLAIPPGIIDAADVCGMGRVLKFRRIVVPLALRYALPGMGNVWQLIIKESALISVTGLVEITRAVTAGANSTRQPFPFYIAGAILYLAIASASGVLLKRIEARHGARRAPSGE